ncbi:HAD family phosphatase [Acidipropionibacterium jensenii]|uniref:HAD family hydrolase n=1 Tax=Acidipropionibacterium jensenii TaxID=1749 RepID=UPI000BC31200|nr:HAD family hydrolase [Acidipropionibacterium jensenii]AZZ41396.1 HAD family phosphatase [Acidipropionibacterium jensenii]
MLIATDLDGTLLSPDGSISPRTRSAVAAAEKAGVPVVPVTARQLYGLTDLRDGLGRWALCSNGAICWDLHAGTVLFSLPMTGEVARRFATALSAAAPGTVFAAIQDDGNFFASQAGYPELCTFSDHHRDPAGMPRMSLAEVTATDCLKLVARHPSLTVAQLGAVAASVADPHQVHITSSGAGMLEVSAAGVTKDTGVSMLAERFGMTRSDVVAFGDGDNDVELLSWAPRSWAVANAVPAALAAADRVAPSNAEDGVAQVIESLLARDPGRVGEARP